MAPMIADSSSDDRLREVRTQTDPRHRSTIDRTVLTSPCITISVTNEQLCRSGPLPGRTVSLVRRYAGTAVGVVTKRPGAAHFGRGVPA